MFKVLVLNFLVVTLYILKNTHINHFLKKIKFYNSKALSLESIKHI